MKKTLALVSLLLVVSPAFGATTVTFDVKLGGDNHAADWANGDVVLYTPGSNAEGVVYGNQSANGVIVNWSVDATVTVGEGENLVYGIANVVFDLELSKDGTLAADFGLGGPGAGAGGFFSSNLDGDQDAGQANADELKAAAFPWSFDLDPVGPGDPGRVFDDRNTNGPNLQQHTYPSTLNFPTGSTALSGTLVGMGAGYTQYTGPNQSGQETAGVGIAVGQGFGLPLGEFCVGLGSLVAEGQLNVSTLPNGTYTLKVVAGAGNNILKNDGSYYCDDGTPGNFASKADQAAGDQITFVVSNIPTCTPPAVTAAVSRRTHTNVGDFDNALSLVNPVTVEPRTAGNPRIVVTYDQAIGGAPSVNLTGGTLGPVTMSGSELTIGITGIANGACVSATISGVDCAAGGAIAPDHTVKFRFLQGDVNRNNLVNVNDVNQVKSSLNQPVTAANFLRDVNANGGINVNDVNITKAGLNKVPDACTY